jgi:hypothetical protein
MTEEILQEDTAEPAPDGGWPPAVVEPPLPPETRFWRLLPQFFLFPLLVVAACLILYFGVRFLTRDTASDLELLRDAQSGERNTGWRAAIELQDRIRKDPEKYRSTGFGAKLVRAWEQARAAKNREVVQYLAMALAQVGGDDVAAALEEGTRDPQADTRFYSANALGRLGEPARVAALLPLVKDPDRGVRTVAVYWAGKIGGAEAVPALVAALGDPEPSVTWNAALVLASRHQDERALPVLKRLLDRSFVERVGESMPANWEDGWPFVQSGTPAEVRELLLVNAIKAAAAFRHPELRAPLEALKERDPSLAVRDLATKALGQFPRQ